MAQVKASTFMEESYGVQIPPELMPKMGRAIILIAAADGELSKAEMDYVIARGRGIGVPEKFLAEARKFDFRSAKLKDVLDESIRPYARILLWDGMRAARADGISEPERQAARKAAKILGLDASIVDAMEGLLEVEAALGKARAALLAPKK